MPHAEFMFVIDPAFEATSHALGSLSLCDARLHADCRYAWIVLIPRREGLIEIEDLSAEDRLRLLDETLLAGRAVRVIGEAMGERVDKLNVGQLGNVTRQLHVHVVGRRFGDPAWPGPVWGHSTAQAYEGADLTVALESAKAALGL